MTFATAGEMLYAPDGKPGIRFRKDVKAKFVEKRGRDVPLEDIENLRGSDFKDSLPGWLTDAFSFGSVKEWNEHVRLKLYETAESERSVKGVTTSGMGDDRIQPPQPAPKKKPAPKEAAPKDPS